MDKRSESMGGSAVSISGRKEPCWYNSQPFHRGVKRRARAESLGAVGEVVGSGVGHEDMRQLLAHGGRVERAERPGHD